MPFIVSSTGIITTWAITTPVGCFRCPKCSGKGCLVLKDKQGNTSVGECFQCHGIGHFKTLAERDAVGILLQQKRLEYSRRQRETVSEATSSTDL